MRTKSFVILLALVLNLTNCTQRISTHDNVNTDISTVEMEDPVACAQELISQVKRFTGTEKNKIVELSHKWGDIVEKSSSEEKQTLNSWANNLSEDDHAYLALLAAVFYFDTHGMNDELDECLSKFRKLQETRPE